MADEDIVQELYDFAYIVNESKGAAVVTMLSGEIFQEAAETIEDLRALVNWLIDTRCGWAEDNTFTLPNGLVWRNINGKIDG